MRALRVFAILFIFICLSVAVFAAGKKDIPPWMENIDTSGRATYLVPKGAKREVIGSQVLVEPPNEYVARRFYEMEAYLEQRFRAIEKAQADLKAALEELTGIVEDLEDNAEIIEKVADLTKEADDLKGRVEKLEIVKEAEIQLLEEEAGSATNGSEDLIDVNAVQGEDVRE